MSDSLTANQNSTPASEPLAQTTPKAAPKYAKLKTIVYGLLGLVIGGISILKFVTRDDLPGCDTQKTHEVIAQIFKEKNVEYKKPKDATTLSTTDDLITCKASVSMSDGALLIDYNISRLPDDKFEVAITSARPQ